MNGRFSRHKARCPLKVGLGFGSGPREFATLYVRTGTKTGSRTWAPVGLVCRSCGGYELAEDATRLL